MDSQFEWKEEFKIGVEVIDKEHQKLFKIINKLLAFKEDETTRQWACREGIKFFKKHAVSHIPVGAFHPGPGRCRDADSLF